MKQRRSLLLSHLVSLCEDKEAHRRRIAYGRWITRETGEDQKKRPRAATTRGRPASSDDAQATREQRRRAGDPRAATASGRGRR
ncbi:hypothetical protein BHM03_00049757 [Ensete ventricosum]|nr:hypothetical protein BHM03_00049757 [Ensete ventricosum]